MKVPYRISDKSISVFIQNRMRVVNADNANFQRLKFELQRADSHNIELIQELADFVTYVVCATHGEIQICDESVHWRGQVLHHVLVKRLLALFKAGQDYQPLALFLDNLMRNPEESARNELYDWLDAGNAPITPDGYFLAFKAVRSDYKDKHSGTMDNSVGQIVTMERTACDPDRNNECSRGLHFCQHDYLQTFASRGDPIMIVKINPADVVSIPRDYNHQKGRTWRLEVVGEVPRDEVASFFDGRVVDDRYHLTIDASFTDDLGPDPAEDLSNRVGIVNGFDEVSRVQFYDGHNINNSQETAIDVSVFDKVENTATQVNNAVQANVKTSNVEFTLNGFTYRASDIIDAVAAYGQRGAAKSLGVARSTLGGWFRKITN